MKEHSLTPVNNCLTFSQMIREIAAFDTRTAIVYFDRTRQEHAFSYSELTGQVNALRAALFALNLQNKHIAIVSENCYEWITAFLAITALGAVAVCVDIEQSDESIREQLRQAEAKTVFASATFLPICAPLAESGEIERMVAIDTAAAKAGLDSLPQLTEQGGKLLPCDFSASPDDTAAIVFTSGTTSRAKPVMLSHRNILGNAAAGMSMVYLQENVFSTLPFYHTYGLTCAVVAPLLLGAKSVINCDVKTVMRDLQLARPDTVISVPLMAEAINNMLWLKIDKSGDGERIRLKIKKGRRREKFGLTGWREELAAIKEESLGQLSLMIVGGAHLDREIAESLRDFGILVLSGYGITECSPLISVNQAEAYQFDSVGHVLPDCQVKIVEGEIWVRGGNVMQGYYREPELTAEVMADGWFKTGDLGSIDKDGFLHITGRIKNLIVLKNGKKVSPEKLEKLLRKIPLVKDVMAYGAASGLSVDDVKPAASIYPDPVLTEGMTSYEILERLQEEVNRINATLPLYQQIQMINICDRELNRNALHKIIRR